MSVSKLTKREISQKTARVAFLKQFITENLPFASQNVSDGFYALAAGKFMEMQANCLQISVLYMEIQQLAFQLERQEAEQTEMALSYGAPPLLQNPI